MIKVEQIIKGIRELAQEYPDAEYDRGGDPDGSCYYSKLEAGPGQGCIIGQVLAKLGIDVKLIDEQHPRGHHVTGVLRDFDIEFSYDDEIWLEEVQYQQDTGTAWGGAVEKADLKIEQGKAVNDEL